jgi:transposase-like protein
MQASKPFPESLTLDMILAHFSTDEKARKVLEEWLWTNGPTCPRCQSNDPETVYKMKGHSIRAGLYNCRACERQFTVTVGTIFEDSHIPIRKWLVAWFLMCSSKKGISSLQLKRILDLGSYRTALFMTHRIRHALKETSFANKLTGTVEVDECYFGPISRRKADGSRRVVKSAVMALVQRDTGERRSVVIERVTARNLHQAVADHVQAGATVNTDESQLYVNMPKQFAHKTVRHAKLRGKREYHRVEANGEVVTTNYAESSFSLLRRGVIGTFHNISRKHLPLYVAEFDFRFNNRKVSDGERTAAAIVKAKGKRLTYKAIKQE